MQRGKITKRSIARLHEQLHAHPMWASAHLWGLLEVARNVAQESVRASLSVFLDGPLISDIAFKYSTSQASPRTMEGITLGHHRSSAAADVRDPLAFSQREGKKEFSF